MRSCLPSDAGLSLTEVMVSVFILSLATSAIVLTAPQRPDPLDTSIAQVTKDIDRLMGLSMVSGKIMGMDLSPEGYQVVSLQSGMWVPLEREYEFSDVKLRNSVQPLTNNIDNTDLPEIRFDPTGIVSPHSFTLSDKKRTATLQVQLNGAIDQEPVS